MVKGEYIPHQMFLSKYLGICYHAVREESADGIWKVGFVKGKNNIYKCLTNILFRYSVGKVSL